MKIAIVVGHNEKAQGAVRATDRRTEFDWNGELAEMIASRAPDEVKVFRRVSGGGYSAELDRVYDATDAWGADVTIELHFNGSSNTAVQGGETLSSGSTKSRMLASSVRARVGDVLGNDDRGVKVKTRMERGGKSLHSGRAPAVLDEPYFGSRASECENASKRMGELAEAYLLAVSDYAAAL